MKSAPTKSYPSRVLAAAAILLPIYLVVLLCAGHLMRLISTQFAYRDWQASMPLTVEDPFEWGTTNFPGAEPLAFETLKPATVSFSIDYPPLIAATRGFGMLDEYIVLPRIEFKSWLDYRETGREGRVAYDPKRGLFVWWVRMKTGGPVYYAFAGPDGVAQECSEDLGRFARPQWQVSAEKLLLIVWDPPSRRFYRYDLPTGRRTVGPVMNEGFDCRRIGVPYGRGLGIHATWNPPQVEVEVERAVLSPAPAWPHDASPAIEVLKVKEWKNTPGFEKPYEYWGEFVPVLLNDGRIVKVDLKTLEVGLDLGHIVIGEREPVTLDGLLAYDVSFLTYQGGYLGMSIAAMRRDARYAVMTVWDEQGKMRGGETIQFEAENMVEESGGVMGVVVEYLLELVHPPVLMVGTHFVGRPDNAAAGWQSLLWRPYGFASSVARDVAEDGHWFAAAMGGLAMLLPGLALSGVLAWWVAADTRKAGLSLRARRAWLWATLLGGPAVWLVYRCSRPRVDRVTCLNCGRLRRTDQPTCHFCQATWRVPHATAPLWRVAHE